MTPMLMAKIRNVKFEKQSILEKLEGMEERFIIEKLIFGIVEEC